MKRMLAFLLLVAKPLAVQAQALPPSPLAQTGTAAKSAGITVTAQGTANIPATSARISLQLGSLNQTPTINSKTVQPIVDALIQAGADPASIELPPGFSAGANTNYATLTVTVKNPTDDLMRKGIETVGAAAMKVSGIRVNGVTVALSALDCATSIEKARLASVAHAREKARSVASDLGVAIGSVLSVSSYDMGQADGSCKSQYTVGPGGPQFSNGMGTSNSYVTIPVVSSITITFAIK